MADKLLGVNIPTDDKISSRTSTVAKSLATSIIPRILPEESEKLKVKSFWEKHGKYINGKLLCAYCSAEATQWDHFHSLIKGSKPTGYITEIQNLVPCCGTCNGSKGGKDWREWLKTTTEDASPKHPVKRISPEDIKKNSEILEEFEKEFAATKLPFNDLKGFDNFWKHYETICSELKAAQKDADKLKNYVTYLIKKTIMDSINFERLCAILRRDLRSASHTPFRKNENNVLYFVVTKDPHDFNLLLEKLQKEFADCKVIDIQHDEIKCVPPVISSHEEGILTPNPVVTIFTNYFVPNSDANLNGTEEQHNFQNAVCFNKDYRVNVLLCHKEEQTRSLPLTVDVANHIHYYPYEYCE